MKESKPGKIECKETEKSIEKSNFLSITRNIDEPL